jgi:peroxiredoxin Q/BCP
MDYIVKNIWMILFVVWGLPLGYYRSKFRKIVYQTDSWIINIKPVFRKEIKAEKHVDEALRILQEMK